MAVLDFLVTGIQISAEETSSNNENQQYMPTTKTGQNVATNVVQGYNAAKGIGCIYSYFGFMYFKNFKCSNI